MALVIADRVKETTTTSGTGTINLAGAVSGFRTFVAGVGTGNTTYYAIVDGTAWEVGIGTVTGATPDTLSRTTVLSSSTGSAISLSGGSAEVFCTIPGARANTVDIQDEGVAEGAAATIDFTGAGVSVTFAAGKASVAIPGGGGGPTYPGCVPLTNALFPAAYNMALPTGDVDLYTVPTGKRVFYMGYSLRNDTGGSITHYATVKIGATYYRLSTNATTTTGGNGAALVGYVAEAGETIAINAATTANGVLCVYAVEFDDTSGFKSAKLTSVSAGDNTLYTVGSGKTAFAQAANVANTFVSLQGVAIGIVNSSGASRTYGAKFTPSGGSTYAVSAASFSVSDVTRSNLTVPGLATMAAGDAVIINTSAATATQFIWLNVLETG